MKLKDLTIGIRLSFGFGAILIMVIILGIISYTEVIKISKSTDDLYAHPYQVGRAVRDIQIGVLEIHRKMKDIAMDETLTNVQINSSVHMIDSIEKGVYASFNIVNDRYLGPKTDAEKSLQIFKEWKPFRDSLIRVRISYGRTAAFNNYLLVNRNFVNIMFKEIQKMIDFSSAKGESFYEDANHEKYNLLKRLIIITISIFVLSVLITIVLLRGIRTPLKALTDVANIYSKGNYNIRCDYLSTNEIGVLSSTFNKMAESVYNDITIKENAAWISRLMMDENELKPFCTGLLKALLSKTESNVAAIYFLNRANGFFEHFESIGLSCKRKVNFSADFAEGEFGTVIHEKKIHRIKDISDDTVFSFSAVTGDYKPKEIITIPIIDGNDVIAVISLASIKEYSVLSNHLLNDIWLTMTARIIGVLSYQKISDFSDTLDKQNKELEQKSRELVMQADELKEYNIELELQKKQLDDANRHKSSFLSNMSHELRTPLNSVIALSGVLVRRLNGIIPEDEYNYIGIIERSGKNLLLLINDILDLSRVEAGKEELFYSRFHLPVLVNEILSSLEPICSEKGISVSVIAREDLPAIISDKNKCHHIMQNIISNAIKFTDHGKIEVSMIAEKDNIQISVTDTGIGISEEFLPFVFDEFRQADDKASRRFGGTGLGLAIVKKYCNLLNCTVDVVSKESIGSTFTIILPLKPSSLHISDDGMELQRESGSAFYNTSCSEKNATGKKLLIVEDTESQIIQLTDILGEEGFLLQVARNGREALDSIKVSIPDAIILDLHMPDIDGFEVLKSIRSLEETKSIPVLILTAKHITKSELSFLKENHIYQLIQKRSLNRNDLLSYIKNLMIPTLKENTLLLKDSKPNIAKTGKAKILVIEDNPDNLITFKALLEEKFAVNSAGNGYEGIEKATSLKPDLILLDISLPVMDGFKVLDSLKQNEELKDIPVVALTARAMKGDREDLLAYGFDGYIAKPIDNDTFEKMIIDYLGKH